MATTNKKAKGRATSKYTSGTVINRGGGSSFELKDEFKLLTGVLTTFFNEPKYYGDTSKELVDTAREMIEKDPEFVAKLACYARNEFHMRTISQVLAAEVAHGAKGSQIIRKMTRRVIERPDDMCNILAYYLDTFGDRKNGNPITRGLRRGIADTFPRFDEYQLAKYRGIGNKVKLRDALLISRPKPQNDEQADLWKRLITDTLKTPETRETILSSKGQSKDTWTDLIRSKKLGYMATLRNLRNILSNDVSREDIKAVANYISNERAVKNSKQLPFRFLSAYREIGKGLRHSEILMDALEEAMEISVENLPKLNGTTLLTADISGSMTSSLSSRSKIRYMDVGCLLMSIAGKFCDDPITSCFGDRFSTISLPKRVGILEGMRRIETEGQKVGWLTHLWTAIEWLIRTKTMVDRIVVFSDMQAYDNSVGYVRNTNSVQTLLNKYKKEVNPNVWIHSIDLSGYGDTKIIADKRTNLIAGWSEKVMHFIKLAESAEGELIDAVRNYQL